LEDVGTTDRRKAKHYIQGVHGSGLILEDVGNADRFKLQKAKYFSLHMAATRFGVIRAIQESDIQVTQGLG
jgi:hypothetical protein